MFEFAAQQHQGFAVQRGHLSVGETERDPQCECPSAGNQHSAEGFAAAPDTVDEFGQQFVFGNAAAQMREFGVEADRIRRNIRRLASQTGGDLFETLLLIFAVPAAEIAQQIRDVQGCLDPFLCPFQTIRVDGVDKFPGHGPEAAGVQILCLPPQLLKVDRGDFFRSFQDRVCDFDFIHGSFLHFVFFAGDR